MRDGLIYLAIGVGAFLVIMTALNILWDRKYRPLRTKKGNATATFANILKRAMRALFKEDTKRKIIAPRDYYIASIVATLAFTFFGQFIIALCVFGLFLMIAFGRARQIMHARHKILMRMFEVANSRLSYGKEASLNPWAWIDVQKWENKTQPGQVLVQFPPRFRVDTPKARDEFQQHFDGVVTQSNAWLYDWKGAEGNVVCAPVPNLPELASYPGSTHCSWDEIPLGLGARGEITWKLSDTPHLLVCGSTGGGKSVVQRNIIFHIIQHSNDIKFLGVDLKRVELKPFQKYKESVLAVATSLEDGVEVMRYGQDEMERRYAIMEEAGVTHFRELPEKMPALLIMVDEAFMFMGSEGIKTDEGKERDELHGEATMIVGAIARLGRASGVHLVIATQRPDAKVIFGEIKANLSARYVAGQVKTTPSLMILDTDTGTRIPSGIKGRGVVQFDGDEQFVQGYFAKQDWIDRWLANRDSVTEDAPVEEIAPAPKKKKLAMFGRKLNFKNEENENPIANLPENEESKFSGFLDSMDSDPEEGLYDEGRPTAQGTSQLDTLMADENIDLDMSTPQHEPIGFADEDEEEAFAMTSVSSPEEEIAPPTSPFDMPALDLSDDRAPKPELPTWDDDLDAIFADLEHNKPSDTEESAVVTDIRAPLEPPQLGNGLPARTTATNTAPQATPKSTSSPTTPQAQKPPQKPQTQATPPKVAATPQVAESDLSARPARPSRPSLPKRPDF